MKSKQSNQVQEKKISNGSKQSSKKQKEANNSNSSELIKYEEVNDTPFTLIEREGTFGILMGSNLLARGLTRDEALERIEKKSWDLILQAGAIYQQHLNRIKK